MTFHRALRNCLLVTAWITLDGSGRVAAQTSPWLTIDSAAVASSGARTLADLLAARVPGLSVTYLTGAPGIGAQVSARSSVGFSGSGRPALIVDGVLMRDDQQFIGERPDGQMLADHWNLPVEEIASVEVVLGAAGGMALDPGASRGAVVVTTHRAHGGAWTGRVFADARTVGAGTAIRPASTRTGDLSGGGSTYYCTLQLEAAGDCVPTGTWTHNPFPTGSPFAAGQRVRAGASAAGGLPFGLQGRVSGLTESDPGAMGSAIARHDVSLALALPRRGRWESELDLRVQQFSGDFLQYSTLRRAATYGPYDADSNLDQQTTYAREVAWAPAWASRRSSVGSRTRVSLTRTTSLALHTSGEWLTRYAARSAVWPWTGGGDAVYEADFESLRRAWTVSLEAREERQLGRIGLTAFASILQNSIVQADSFRTDVYPDVGEAFGSESRQRLTQDRSVQRLGARLVDRSGVSGGAGVRREAGFAPDEAAVLPFADLRWDWSPPSGAARSRLGIWTAYGEAVDPQGELHILGRRTATFSGLLVPGFERTRERELGAEAGWFSDAVLLSGRLFRRDVSDAVRYELGGFPGQPENVVRAGGIATRGGEIALRLSRRIGERSRVASTVWAAVAGSEHVGTFSSMILFGPGGVPNVSLRIAPQSPFGEISVHRRSFVDANLNGVVEPSELGDWEVADRGSLVPTRLYGATFEAVRGPVSVGGTLDGKAGHVRVRNDAGLCSGQRCEARYDPNTSLEDQAAAISLGSTLEDASFVRVREVWLRWEASDGRLGGMSLSFIGQNLLTFARSSGDDPETGTPYAAGLILGFYQQPIAPSVGLRVDFRGIGSARSTR
ncbi:MAG: TonB-dependent receptor plug domain-containing protein [Gemmatimonadaceae bacterium]|nr:TonB-dependent receptor plug domain-containing protein [Gemmatimonadaceae bacterium]MCW5825016.1 TonB-dependent receptor plug domain-containing protein [Gemmatimonadaceae bacterium]